MKHGTVKSSPPASLSHLPLPSLLYLLKAVCSSSTKKGTDNW